jgi:uncharacterized protein (DUF849 family)
MLQVCLNGGRDPGLVPVTAESLVAEAVASIAAGAHELHLHPRGADGAETLAPAEVAACIAAVRATLPGVPLGLSTGAWIAPGGRARHAHIADWTERPDYCSVNLGEEDAPEVIALLRGMGVGIEAGLWCRADAERFLSEVNPADCLRILIEMPDVVPDQALAEAEAVLALVADRGLPVLLHGEGQSAWPCILRAAELGLDTRVGLEDVLHLPDGTPAPGNAALVAAARAIGMARVG